jgi:hypothetical protein
MLLSLAENPRSSFSYRRQGLFVNKWTLRKAGAASQSLDAAGSLLVWISAKGCNSSNKNSHPLSGDCFILLSLTVRLSA